MNQTFRCRLIDRKYGDDMGTESVYASTKTEARAKLAKAWREDTPRDARASGFVPFSDLKIVWIDD